MYVRNTRMFKRHRDTSSHISSFLMTSSSPWKLPTFLENLNNFWVCVLKEATELYFTHYTWVVIVLFNMALCRSAVSIISTASFGKLVFRLSVLSAFFLNQMFLIMTLKYVIMPGPPQALPYWGDNIFQNRAPLKAFEETTFRKRFRLQNNR